MYEQLDGSPDPSIVYRPPTVYVRGMRRAPGASSADRVSEQLNAIRWAIFFGRPDIQETIDADGERSRFADRLRIVQGEGAADRPFCRAVPAAMLVRCIDTNCGTSCLVFD